MKKSLKWLIAAGVALIVAALCVVLWLVCDTEEAAGTPQVTFDLYWNVEPSDYRTQRMIRTQDSEGIIYVTLAHNGEQKRYPIKEDVLLANAIDQMDVMCLGFDADGYITACYSVDALGGKILAKDYLVTSVEGNTVTCNSSGSGLGYDVTFDLGDETGVWDVTTEDFLCGIPGQIQIDDLITVVQSPDQRICAVYTSKFEGPKDIYWNVDRKYDSVTKTTTREMDVTGGFTIEVAVNGQLTTVKTREYEIVQAMDAMVAKCFALEFDEEGLVSKVIHAGTAAGGGSCASWYRVDEYSGKEIFATKPSTGVTYSGVVSPHVVAYDVSGHGSYMGEPTTVRVGDTVHCLRDSLGRVAIVFVVRRVVESEIYWNLERMWDATNSVTTRTPAADGWYYIDLAVCGKQITVKTQDKELVQAMDARPARCFGLKLEGDVVQKVYMPDSVTGGAIFASWYDVTAIDGKTITCIKSSTGDVRTGTMLEDCEIYNVSSTATVVGEVTTLQVGDKIHSLKDSNGKICYIFVVNRYVNYPTYYNLERKWDSNTKSTTRTPDSNGYYVFEMAYNGKQVTVKTKNKEIANEIDSQAARCIALQITGGVVTKAIHPMYTLAYKGGPTSSYTTVTSLSKTGFQTQKVQDGKVTKSYKETFASDCKIYNVSGNVISHKGEPTTLQKGDYVHCLKNVNGQVALIYVLTRYENYPTYYNLVRKWDDTTKSTTRTPDSNGYYVFEMAYNGKQVTVKTKSLEIANDMDSQVARCVALQITDGVVTKAIHPMYTQAYKGGPSSSYTTVTSLSKTGFKTQKVQDGKVTKTYNETFASDCKIYNVSANVTSHKGEPTTLQVGDYVHCLQNADGQVALIYVLTRYENMGVYYNLDRKWDDANKITTRTPDSNGYYVFTMAHGGKEITVKTKLLDVANVIDSQVARVVGLSFDKNGLATKAVHAQYTQECKGGIGVSYETIIAINGSQVTTEKDGETKTFTVSQNPNIFDVSATYKVNRGEITTLRVGDYIHCLENKDNQAHYIYVLRRVAVIAPVAHSCQHVTEPVTWYEWDGVSAPGDSGYYVLNQDAVLPESITIPEGKEITICLNGHTVTSDVRMFRVYGTLNLCDHKDAEGNYLGKLSSSYCDTVDENGNVTTKAYGAIAYLYNSNASCRLNIYGGVYEHTGEVTRGGLVYIGNKQDVPENKASFYLYDGILTGGKAVEYGGAVMVTNNGHFTMYGGKITNSQSASGGAIAINNVNASIEIAGGIITGNSSTDNGGALHMDNGLLTISGGNVVANTATGSGGGVNVQGGRFVMTGGLLDSNTGKEGGNVRINKAGEVLLLGNALVQKGNARNGGNITMFGKLTIAENAVITGGVATNLGSAISVFSNYADSQVELNVLGGTVDGVVRYNSGKGESVVLNILGGTVEQVDFEKNENATVQRQLYVGGTANVKLVNLAAGKQIQIHEMGLEDTASICVDVADLSVPFAVITDPMDTACFRAYKDDLYQVENVENQLYLVSTQPKHIHCLCNGAAVGLGDHVCEETATWTAWTDEKALPTTSGYYYLETDVTLDAMFEMKGRLDLKICLNGHTIYGPGGGKRAFLLRDADLSIADCTGNGVITNEATDTLTGGLIYQYSGSSTNEYNNSVNLYGGTLTITGKAKTAGVLILGNKKDQDYTANFNMYGGQVIGGQVAENGGAIQLTNKAACNIYGGQITGGEIYHTSGTLNLLGGSISKVRPLTTTTVGGNVQIAELYLAAGKTVKPNAEKPLDGAMIYVAMETPGRFITLTDLTAAECFQSLDSAYTVENTNGALSLAAVVVAPTQHTHCLCNGAAVGLGDHVCEETATWTAWTAENALPSTSGYYYLETDVNLETMFEMKDKLDLKICLNGHTITGPGGGKRAFLLRDADLSITDCTGNGVVTNEVTDSLTGGLIYQYSGKSCNAYNNTVNLYGGTLTTTGTAKSGGVLYLGNDDSLPYYATFNMYGGMVTGGKTTAQGGNITMTKKSQLNLYGGVISDGEAGGVGGNISQNANAGTMRLLGGQIMGNDVFVDETVILGGQVQIDRLHLKDGHSATLSDAMPLTGKASVGIVKSKAEQFAEAVTDETMVQFFEQVGTSWSVVYDPEAKTLSFTK